ncbi:MAG TPA: alpha/beta fold hydrolase [Caldimonas sp.]
MNLIVDGAEGPQRAYAYSGGKPFERELPAVVFVHGALHDHSVWTLLARWFAHHGHAVLAPDLPGHARSEGPPRASVEALAAWLLSLLDAAGVEKAALVGHSMGSLVALEAAALAQAGITAGTIRLSIGLEDAADLIDDLKRALGVAKKAG